MAALLRDAAAALPAGAAGAGGIAGASMFVRYWWQVPPRRHVSAHPCSSMALSLDPVLRWEPSVRRSVIALAAYNDHRAQAATLMLDHGMACALACKQCFSGAARPSLQHYLFCFLHT